MYKAIIADDEKELRNYLKSLLADAWPDLEICGEAANGKEALELVESCRPQVAFLDIKMPGLTGLEVAKKIAGICHVVFVTAFDQYAVEAFEREAIDYLVKPVTKKRLTQTIRRLKKQFKVSSEPPVGLADMITQVLSNLKNNANTNYLHWIKAQHRDSVRLIPVEDVDYFQAKDKYTTVMTAEGETLIKKSIKELALELDPRQFWQINRGTIVNVAKIVNVRRCSDRQRRVKNKRQTGIFYCKPKLLASFQTNVIRLHIDNA